MQPIQFYSCFISSSSKDEAFAQRLYERMRAAHLRVWFAPEDVKGGEKLHEQIEQAIQVHDRLLLILSEESIRSSWVQRELRRARKAELASGRRKLFPIRLVDYTALYDWECVDFEGNDVAEEVRQYFIPDFTNWKDHDAFEATFSRLLRDLKLTEAPPVPASPKQTLQVALTSEHLSQQQQLLARHRGTLVSYLERRAILGKAHATPEITHGISDARKEIARIKNFLREKGVEVEDHPDDEGE
jgi:ribosomal protein L29